MFLHTPKRLPTSCATRVVVYAPRRGHHVFPTPNRPKGLRPESCSRGHCHAARPTNWGSAPEERATRGRTRACPRRFLPPPPPTTARVTTTRLGRRIATPIFFHVRPTHTGSPTPVAQTRVDEHVDQAVSLGRGE